jgi:hypothetical protein
VNEAKNKMVQVNEEAAAKEKKCICKEKVRAMEELTKYPENVQIGFILNMPEEVYDNLCSNECLEQVAYYRILNSKIIEEKDSTLKICEKLKKNETELFVKLEATRNEVMILQEFVYRKDFLINDLTDKLTEAKCLNVKNQIVIDKWNLSKANHLDIISCQNLKHTKQGFGYQDVSGFVRRTHLTSISANFDPIPTPVNISNESNYNDLTNHFKENAGLDGETEVVEMQDELFAKPVIGRPSLVDSLNCSDTLNTVSIQDDCNESFMSNVNISNVDDVSVIIQENDSNCFEKFLKEEIPVYIPLKDTIESDTDYHSANESQDESDSEWQKHSSTGTKHIQVAESTSTSQSSSSHQHTTHKFVHKINCFKCGKEGHVVKRCPNLKHLEDGSKTKRPSNWDHQKANLSNRFGHFRQNIKRFVNYNCFWKMKVDNATRFDKPKVHQTWVPITH